MGTAGGATPYGPRPGLAGAWRLAGLLGLTGLLLGGCGSAPPRPAPPAPPPVLETNPVVKVAQAVVGAPYRYGGESPTEGFDCSGLVQYAYGRIGVAVPRTVREQYRRLVRIPTGQLTPGDLVFFLPPGGGGMHVGIYLGDGRFLHAPSSGKRVGYGSLANPYWQACFVGGRRPPGPSGAL
jgi:cell wall-associated NlpC family hydrolase